MTTAVEERTVKGVKVGDVFYASWGYDQTNVNWYKVVALTAKSAKVQEVRGRTVQDNGPTTYVVPTDEPMTFTRRNYDFEQGRQVGEPTTEAVPVVTKVVKGEGSGVYLNWQSYADLYLWDGKPKYVTGWGYGH